MDKRIKILDCTLRDGGYVNNWEFGITNFRKIISGLMRSGLDYIECGFLQDGSTEEQTTLFPSLESLEKLLPDDCDRSRLAAMVTYGKFDVESLPNRHDNSIPTLRLIFKRGQEEQALQAAQSIINKGYNIFVNPTFIEQWRDAELIRIIEKVNSMDVMGFAIVDSSGLLRGKQMLRLLRLLDTHLRSGIGICFHSHNNLQLSFSNAQLCMQYPMERTMVIDSSVFGMGRGAGNLCTELLVQHMNEEYGGQYDILPLLRIIDEYLHGVFMKMPWGYSVPYYLSATNGCHPNYAGYLLQRRTLPVEQMDFLLKSIPSDQKGTFNKKLIEEIYLNYQSQSVDDSSALLWLKHQVKGKRVLLLGPGKSLSSFTLPLEGELSYYTISVNFIPKISHRVDSVFVGNQRRYDKLKTLQGLELAATSNVDGLPESAQVFCYDKYINNSPMQDNSVLMLLSILCTIGCGEVYLAGFDGFHLSEEDNYIDSEMMNHCRAGERDLRNDIIGAELKRFSQLIKLYFITPTLYKL